MENLNAFTELICESSNIVFFGGAGVSTESGMKDYRSEDGLYNTVKQYGLSPESILSKSFFDSHPDVFYDFYYNYFLNTTAAPNRAHKALVELEKMGKLKAIVTQNIDGLHQSQAVKPSTSYTAVYTGTTVQSVKQRCRMRMLKRCKVLYQDARNVMP